MTMLFDVTSRSLRLIASGLLLTAGAVSALDVSFSGQASAWLTGNHDTAYALGGGLRYLPALKLNVRLSPTWSADAELTANAFASATSRLPADVEAEVRLKPYRLIARLASERFEARAGLQKLNFGSATLLRPLMWFDRIDPRDPLQMTDGVYALLARYYFPGEVNVWAWGLLGNDSTKGWEIFPTERWTVEPGGRVQVPVPRGEIAATYHYRQAYATRLGAPEYIHRYYEHRIGLDGKWDLGVGLSFEVVATTYRPDEHPGWITLLPRWQHAAMVGADYTVPLGNGLGLLVEHMVIDTADRPVDFGEPYHLTAATASYPLGLLDQVRLMAVYDWRGHNWYRYLSWQRTYDNWIFSVAGFWNPAQSAAGPVPGSNAAGGKGVQIMVVFNH